VKFVPFFAFLLFRRQISASTWISAGTALLGTALLASDGDNTVSWNVGDLWSVAAAAASAMYILRLESATKTVSNAAALNAACLWAVTGASVLWSAYLGRFQVDTILSTMLSHPLELLYLSAVTTTIANWIQTKAQKKVTAERASVIYAMDPVWGAIWANILLGETLTGMGLLGALLITAAAATNAFLDFGGEKSSDKN
jgi:drug/metabolite transporter (DMT)-like permease